MATKLEKKINPFRISLSKVAEAQGCENCSEMIEMYANESVVPACCSEGCDVEPDGRCPHGCPSIMLAVGVI